jgi:transcriptional regulator with XRE-family HTH domain
MLTTGNQLRAARALVDMDQGTLANRAGVNINTISFMEKRAGEGLTSGLDKVRAVMNVLEAEGIEFLNHGNPGVRLRDFRAGDRVRLRRGTTIWAQYHDLKDSVGTVRAVVNDGTSMKRITVAYGEDEIFTGIDANLFEFARDGSGPGERPR